MVLHPLFESSYLTIWHDATNQWLYAEWKGPQSLAAIREGCQCALAQLPAARYTKILNDSTQATGNWVEAAQWLGQQLFPHLSALGLQYMAWIYAADFNSRFAIDATLRCARSLTIVTFDDMDAACAWLQQVDKAPKLPVDALPVPVLAQGY
jgi:hypothetical protein